MSVEQYQRTLNLLDKDIADLEGKKATVDIKIAELKIKIEKASDQARKTKIASTVKSKLNQISGWEKDLAKKTKDSSDYGKKISDKGT